MSQKNDRNDIDTEDLRDHVFDGIQEYDKKLPNWWLMTFYGSIAFSIVYWFVYHTSGVGLTQEEKFARQQERIAAEARAAGLDQASNESLIELSRDESVVAAGRNAYAANCAACHGANLGGGIGAALKNGDWKYGAEPMEIRQNIREGILDAGMPPWRQSLGDRGINSVVAFLLSENPDLIPDEEENGD